jgi:hypothetical protein
MATTFLDENRGAKIEITWVPGHMGIEGNDRADELAKEATELEPITEITTIAKLHRQIHDRLKKEWISEWARKPMTGRYAISDRLPPSLAGSHAFHTLDRHTLGIVTQEPSNQRSKLPMKPNTPTPNPRYPMQTTSTRRIEPIIAYKAG